MEQNNEIILFETSDKKVTLSVPMDGDSMAFASSNGRVI